MDIAVIILHFVTEIGKKGGTSKDNQTVKKV